MRKEYPVMFYLDDEREQKLFDLFNRWNTLYPNDEDTPEKFFEFVMTLGSSYVIDDRFDDLELRIRNTERKRGIAK